MEALVDLEKLKEYAKKAKPWVMALATGNPAIIAGTLLFELLKNQGRLTENDSKNVVEIIKAGAESNVDALNIRMNKQDALGLDIKLKSLKTQRPFTFILGASGQTDYEIKVKYK
jgi:hypothetical protein